MPWLRSIDEHRATVWTAWATFFVPLGLATAIGIATGQSVSYFIGMAIVSGLPVVAGAHDWIFEAVQWLERERKRQAEAARRAKIVASRGEAFRADLSEMSFAELRLLCQAFNFRLKGVARAADSLEVTGLVSRGFLYHERGYTPGGFPFYFTDEFWVLINELPNEVFAARDQRAATANVAATDLPPMRPVEVPVPRWKQALALPPRLAITVALLLVQAAGFMVFGHAVAAAYMLLVALAAGVLIGGGWLVALGIGWLL